jgi:hypothetical protein
MDEDGYPTEETLDRLKNWDYKDIPGLFDFITSLWIYENYWNYENDELHISTGGWSGHEELIAALKENSMVWILSWVQSRRGGHYIFKKKAFKDDKE